jgi:hypothetical protein
VESPFNFIFDRFAEIERRRDDRAAVRVQEMITEQTRMLALLKSYFASDVEAVDQMDAETQSGLPFGIDLTSGHRLSFIAGKANLDSSDPVVHLPHIIVKLSSPKATTSSAGMTQPVRDRRLVLAAAFGETIEPKGQRWVFDDVDPMKLGYHPLRDTEQLVLDETPEMEVATHRVLVTRDSLARMIAEMLGGLALLDEFVRASRPEVGMNFRP